LFEQKLNKKTSFRSNYITIKKICLEIKIINHIYYLKIWDIRNPGRCERKYAAHLKIVHLDWHPEEKNWLATASSDKQICVQKLKLMEET
jgi:WD40 repeat protein